MTKLGKHTRKGEVKAHKIINNTSEGRKDLLEKETLFNEPSLRQSICTLLSEQGSIKGIRTGLHQTGDSLIITASPPTR